ncbi:peptide/nickel transport system permease protein [Evansella vedderi]|uniref:Nickel import system permease protein NikB n=1 Tax=Evansella vedderi TaxID=38282 RepID=A0ABT9ZR57_9BACI|nr:nickel ABC transporter permease [Evansella vedderi]MDQ0252938.1 peptide/nickel transport system permease protein [Evansella vedderi]
MFRFVMKRLLMLIPVLIGVSLIVFTLMQLTPGDPAQIMLGPQASQEDIENMREQMGLNEPIYVQYFKFLFGIVTLDFGRSIQDGQAVITKIFEHLPATLKLTFAAMVVAIAIGVPVGIISATRQYSFFDHTSTIGALVGFSMPNYWLSLMLIIIFAVNLNWLPVSGYGGMVFLILPAIALGTQTAAVIMRMTRSSMLEVLRSDYIRTARAKGLTERAVIYVHALKNALIPIITVVGLQVGVLLEGAILTEAVFSWPGIGRFMVDAIRAKDFPVVQGSVLFIAFLFVMVNLLVDVLYAYIDPRIKAQYK